MSQEEENTLKDMDFCHLREIFITNIKKKLLDTGLDALKTASKKVVYKAAEARSEIIGNETANNLRT